MYDFQYHLFILYIYYCARFICNIPINLFIIILRFLKYIFYYWNKLSLYLFAFFSFIYFISCSHSFLLFNKDHKTYICIKCIKHQRHRQYFIMERLFPYLSLSGMSRTKKASRFRYLLQAKGVLRVKIMRGMTTLRLSHGQCKFDRSEWTCAARLSPVYRAQANISYPYRVLIFSE